MEKPGFNLFGGKRRRAAQMACIGFDQRGLSLLCSLIQRVDHELIHEWSIVEPAQADVIVYDADAMTDYWPQVPKPHIAAIGRYKRVAPGVIKLERPIHANRLVRVLNATDLNPARIANDPAPDHQRHVSRVIVPAELELQPT